jgi:hypothetical protein
MENHSRLLYLWLQKNILLLLICKRWLYLYYFIVSLIFVNQARGKQHLCGHYSQNIFHNKSMAETHPAVILMSPALFSPTSPAPHHHPVCPRSRTRPAKASFCNNWKPFGTPHTDQVAKVPTEHPLPEVSLVLQSALGAGAEFLLLSRVSLSVGARRNLEQTIGAL